MLQVNDVHSKLNAADVEDVVAVDSLDAIRGALTGTDLPVAIAGGGWGIRQRQTGADFATALEELIELPGVLDERGLPRFGAEGDPAHPGLYFNGFRESPRGALYEANRDARRLGEAASRYLAAAAASVSG